MADRDDGGGRAGHQGDRPGTLIVAVECPVPVLSSRTAW